ncbi:hypothetical protein AAVH_21401 [Aphelenchoides avenae]|nr:hypothetical protein AAVH_21401 [Aphelenchus avenae]
MALALTDIPTDAMIEVVTTERRDDTGSCLKTQAANIPPAEAMEQTDGTEVTVYDGAESKEAALEAENVAAEPMHGADPTVNADGNDAVDSAKQKTYAVAPAACPLCLRSAKEDATEDTDSAMAVCGEEDVAHLMDEMKAQVEAEAERNEAKNEVPPAEVEEVEAED